MLIHQLDSPRLVRFDDLNPRWGVVPKSTEPGYMRWLVSYGGGPEGYVNYGSETGLLTDYLVVGLMGMPRAQRQFGLHIHTITEIYVILAGHVESLEPEGGGSIAGPMDLVFIPPGAPHCVRTVGAEDVLLLWIHDAQEPNGAARYVDSPDLVGTDFPRARVLAHDALEPSWNGRGAKEPGRMRSTVSYIGGETGQVNFNRGVAEPSSRVALGHTVVPAYNTETSEAWSQTRYCVIVGGRARLAGHPELGDAASLDCFVVPPRCEVGLRSLGPEPLSYLWLMEGVEAQLEPSPEAPQD